MECNRIQRECLECTFNRQRKLWRTTPTATAHGEKKTKKKKRMMADFCLLNEWTNEVEMKIHDYNENDNNDDDGDDNDDVVIVVIIIDTHKIYAQLS